MILSAGKLQMMKKLLFLLLAVTNLSAQTKITNKVLIPFRDKNLWGLSDTLGKVLVKPFAKEIKDFIITRDGEFNSRYVVKTNKTYYVINKNKTVFLPENNLYDSIALNKYFPNHFWIWKKGKIGLYHNNKEIIPCDYDKVKPVSNESYLVKKNELYGLINSQGKLIIPIEYVKIRASWDEADEKNPKFVWVAKGLFVEKKFYDTRIVSKENIDYGDIVGIKEMGEQLLEEPNLTKIKQELLTIYDEVEIDQYNELIYVKKAGKKGVVDFNSKQEMIAPLYDEVSSFAYDRDEKVFKVKLQNHFGLVKTGNKIMVEPEFDAIENDRESGLCVLTKDNKKGAVVFNTIYPYIKAKYKDIKSKEAVYVSKTWQFGLFEVTTEKCKGYVGENGVEFFKD